MEHTSQTLGYQKVLTAIELVAQLQHTIVVIRDGCGIAIPTDAMQYTTKIHSWLLEHKEMLEEELRLAATVDQYGNPLYRCPECETPQLENVYENDTDFAGILIYGTCPDCDKEFVSQDGGKNFEEAA